jgi:signal transduction histidine kinase
MPSSQTDMAPDISFGKFALMAAGVGIWEMNIQTLEFSLDEGCQHLLGLEGSPLVSVMQFMKYIHPDDVKTVDNAIKSALRGDGNGKFDIQFRTIGEDRKLRWSDFSGQCFFDAERKPYRFGGVAKDITEHMLSILRSDRSVPETDNMLRSVISSAPVGIGLFVGRDLIIEMPNKIFVDIVGKGPDIVGRSLKEVMPELHNQPFLDILDDIFTTGKTFQAPSAPVNINQNGKMVTNYYNVTFTPLLDGEGKTYAILDISMDVTEAALARNNLEQAQRTLEDAIELANLATWSLDLQSGTIEYSDRMKSWLGVDEGRSLDKGIQALPEYERERVSAALRWAMNPESGGLFDMEYAIVNAGTKRERIIHAQARTFFDQSGKPVKMTGTALDVTDQRNRRLVLEQEVQERTEELDAANEELISMNEELLGTNEELAQLNRDLKSSNDSLEQFAHVASHDLKEPVRKIKTFLGMIEADPGSSLSDRSRLYIERVNSASDRMFSMINGVLTFSTANSTGHPVENVDLEKTIGHILQDLEVLIAQKNAVIKQSDLPIIEGAEILLYQLFSNLIINSIKFSKNDVPPVIEISGSAVTEKNTVFAQIIVTDNGIGFDPTHSQEIFRTFARLHSKDKYEGTGLGLALCQKIVEQHGGRIEATGEPGAGARFTILLPIRQAGDVV